MKNLKYIVFLLVLVACQSKKDNQNSHRCLYDQPVFAKCVEEILKNEAEFTHFKRNPILNILWENLSEEEGKNSLNQIRTKAPFLLEKLDKMRENDGVGSPRVYSYEGIGKFSPTTLRNGAIAADLFFRLNGAPGQRLIQIGAGYGGLCKIISHICNWESYTIVDLPEQLNLAKKYLELFGVNQVIYMTPDELQEDASYDCALSDGAFSEFNRSYQMLFFDRIFSRAHAGYLLGHVFSKHFGVIPLNVFELKNCFEKSGKFSNWEFEEPTIEKENYLIFWKNKE